MSKRECGGCTACCLTHLVRDLLIPKPQGVLCQHCTVGVGCQIYSRRPRTCSLFECQWLKGFGEESDRPDRSGVVVDMFDGIIYLYEAISGALASSQLARGIERDAFLRDVVVIRVPLGGQAIALFRDGAIISLALRRGLKEAGVEIGYAAV